MGVMCRAVHNPTLREVALKIISPRLINGGNHQAIHDAVENFCKEVPRAISCEGPGVVPLYDAGRIGTVPFIAYRYAEYGDLESYLQKNTITPEVQRRVVEESLMGLVTIHESGFIHRDIKPANLMAGKKQGNPWFSWGDFGSAIMIPTMSRDLVGTPAYTPQEIFLQQPWTQAADIYAFGLTMAYLFTRESPYAGKDIHEIITAQSDGIHPFPLRTLENIQDPWRVMIDRCLRHDPTQRPTARELQRMMSHRRMTDRFAAIFK